MCVCALQRKGETVAKVRIFAKNKEYSGNIGSVVFVNGEGVVDDETNQSELRYFKRQPYGIGEAVPEDDPKESEGSEGDNAGGEDKEPVVEQGPVEIPGLPGSKATRPEWVEFAEGMGIATEGISIAQMRDKIFEAHTAK